jgi:hypothetical protein
MVEEQGRLVEVEVSIRHYGMEDIVAIFADVSAVQHGTGQFVISFFQLHPPLQTTPTPMSDIPKEMPAKCVSRVVLSPAHFTKFVEAVQNNLEKYNRQQREIGSLRGE